MTIQSDLLPAFLGYIDGQWREADSGSTFSVINPATGELLAEVPSMGTGETVRAIEAAARAMRDIPPPAQRRQWLQALATGLQANLQELGRILTLEQGKPLKESQAEIEYSAGFFGFYASHLEALQPHDLPERPRGCRWTIHHRPAGVAGLITPWNFPQAMLAKKISAALAGGCAMVVKPASLTPLSGMAFAAIAEQAGIPAGWINLLTGSAGPIGETLCTHPRIRLISFTGSTEVGRELIAATAPHIKRLTLELGGNAPFIVFEDADLDRAADELISNKFRAGGQTCVCTNRVYVQAGIADEFNRRVVARVNRLRVGNGLEKDVDIGPLINRAAFDKVAHHVQDAIEKGARRAAGEEPQRPPQDFKAYFPPTVLTGVNENMLVCREETFGPVLAITTFGKEREAVERANGVDAGLAAYVFTGEPVRGQRVIEQLRFGHVGLNVGTGPTPEAPFGGMKQSGFGREGGVEGLFEFCETQVVAQG